MKRYLLMLCAIILISYAMDDDSSGLSSDSLSSDSSLLLDEAGVLAPATPAHTIFFRQRFQGAHNLTYDLHLSHDGTKIAGKWKKNHTDKTTYITVWNCETRKKIDECSFDADYVDLIGFTCTNAHIIIKVIHGEICEREKDILYSWQFNSNAITECASLSNGVLLHSMSEDGQILITSKPDKKSMTVHNLASGHVEPLLLGDNEKLLEFLISPDGKKVVVNSSDDDYNRQRYVIDVPTKKILCRIEKMGILLPGYTVFTHDNKLLGCLGEREFQLIDLTEKTCMDARAPGLYHDDDHQSVYSLETGEVLAVGKKRMEVYSYVVHPNKGASKKEKWHSYFYRELAHSVRFNRLKSQFALLIPKLKQSYAGGWWSRGPWYHHVSTEVQHDRPIIYDTATGEKRYDLVDYWGETSYATDVQFAPTGEIMVSGSDGVYRCKPVASEDERKRLMYDAETDTESESEDDE